MLNFQFWLLVRTFSGPALTSHQRRRRRHWQEASFPPDNAVTRGASWAPSPAGYGVDPPTKIRFDALLISKYVCWWELVRLFGLKSGMRHYTLRVVPPQKVAETADKGSIQTAQEKSLADTSYITEQLRRNRKRFRARRSDHNRGGRSSGSGIAAPIALGLRAAQACITLRLMTGDIGSSLLSPVSPVLSILSLRYQSLATNIQRNGHRQMDARAHIRYVSSHNDYRKRAQRHLTPPKSSWAANLLYSSHAIHRLLVTPFPLSLPFLPPLPSLFPSFYILFHSLAIRRGAMFGTEFCVLNQTKKYPILNGISTDPQIGRILTHPRFWKRG